ncbi:MAG: class I SAM-dependent methyltransferase [Anaerolineae bacterium]
MDSQIAARLLELNRRFYDQFGSAFAATRRRLQPGVRRILETLQGDETLLDLGCGNGELARELGRRRHRGAYLGLDFSLPLLREAELAPQGFTARFLQADLTQLPALVERLSLPSGWEIITAFAVLHHIPGQALRLDMLRTVHRLLAPQGYFIHSNWQFLHSEKLHQRIQPWETIGLPSAAVDPGDYLLDWRHGGHSLRYVHHFSEAELATLAAQSGFRLAESFYSDGEGGRLGLYQIWEKAENHMST